jgi:dethiobiotin synthetase
MKPRVPSGARRAASKCSGSVVFVTGTDTGVGKTVVVAWLWALLRQRGLRAVALKPLCSGGDDDVVFLQRIQRATCGTDSINYACFAAALAPALAARKEGRRLRLADLCGFVDGFRGKYDVVLVEGCGGLMVPLAEDALVLDWIKALKATTVVVGRNRLGVINHILLTVNQLQRSRCPVAGCVLVNARDATLASEENAEALRRLQPRIPLEELHFIRCIKKSDKWLDGCSKIFEKTLARSPLSGILRSAFPKVTDRRRK